VLLAGLAGAMATIALFHGIALRLNIQQRLQGPSAEHIFGTDALGRDLFSCLVLGTLLSLSIALAAVLVSVVCGSLLGFAAAWYGGWVDACVSRAVDFILAFPGILFSLTLLAFCGPGVLHLILALVIGGWATYARLLRGEVLKLRDREFILASRGFNASAPRIAMTHVAPLVLPLLMTQAALGVAGVILLESSLNFLGVGLDPRLPSLGQMIDSGRGHIFVKPELILLPGGCLVILIAAFLLLADGGARSGSSGFATTKAMGYNAGKETGKHPDIAGGD
jgi:peptide/nickel transport system permease protein